MNPWNIFLANNQIKHVLQLFNRTNKIMNFHREIFENYLIIKHYGLINLTLKTMGEVTFESITIDELINWTKAFGEKMQVNITNNLVK